MLPHLSHVQLPSGAPELSLFPEDPECEAWQENDNKIMDQMS